MKRSLLSLSLIAALLCSGPVLLAQEASFATSAVSQFAPDPAQHVRSVAQALRSNDLATVARAALPPDKYAALRAAYELKQAEPISDSERVEFAEKVGKLTAPDAIDVLMAEIEPKLVEARPKAVGAVLLGLGALQMALASEDNDLSVEQRASLQAMLPGLQSWANSTDFLNSDLMRQSLSLIAAAARSTGIDSLEALRQLSFDNALNKAGTMLAAGKQAAALYGLNIDAIVDSLQVDVLSVDGATARVRSTVTLFNASVSTEQDLVLINGQWYDKALSDSNWKSSRKEKS